jgi:hypothetical protein
VLGGLVLDRRAGVAADDRPVPNIEVGGAGWYRILCDTDDHELTALAQRANGPGDDLRAANPAVRQPTR